MEMVRRQRLMGCRQTDQPANEKPVPTSTVLYRKEYTREALAFLSVVATTGAVRLRKQYHFRGRAGTCHLPLLPPPISISPYRLPSLS